MYACYSQPAQSIKETKPNHVSTKRYNKSKSLHHMVLKGQAEENVTLQITLSPTENLCACPLKDPI